MKERKPISDEHLKQELINAFEQGVTVKHLVYEHLRTSFRLMKQRVLQMYDVVHPEWAKKKSAAQSEAIHDGEKERLKKAAMKREEALKYLADVAKIVYNRLARSADNPKPNDVLAFNSTIDRISKMEGWEAPKKIANTDKDGNDVKPLDYSVLSFDDLMKLKEINEKCSA